MQAENSVDLAPAPGTPPAQSEKEEENLHTPRQMNSGSCWPAPNGLSRLMNGSPSRTFSTGGYDGYILENSTSVPSWLRYRG